MRATTRRVFWALLLALFVSVPSASAFSAGGPSGKTTNANGTAATMAPGFGGDGAACPWCSPRPSRTYNIPNLHLVPGRDGDTVIVSNGGVLTPNQIVSTTTIQQIGPGGGGGGGGPTMTANFTGNPTIGFAPLGVQFTDTSTGATPGAWAWSFGDGTGSGAPNPFHVYTAPGTYNVRLTISGVGTSSILKMGFITVF